MKITMTIEGDSADEVIHELRALARNLLSTIPDQQSPINAPQVPVTTNPHGLSDRAYAGQLAYTRARFYARRDGKPKDEANQIAREAAAQAREEWDRAHRPGTPTSDQVDWSRARVVTTGINWAEEAK